MKSLRYERKYLIDRRMQSLVLEYLSPYIVADINTPTRYQVTSLYFDTQRYDSYWDSIDGNEKRKKFRIRYYNHLENSFFLEVKTKVGLKSKKERSACSTNPIPYFSRRTQTLAGSDSEFTHYFYKKKLRPVLWVQYSRSAYNSRHKLDGVRITFDESVLYSRYTNLEKPEFLDGNTIYKDKIIMEVKTNIQSPTWIRQFVNDIKESRTSISKYVMACQKIKTKRY